MTHPTRSPFIAGVVDAVRESQPDRWTRHLGGDGTCQCRSIVNEGFAGGIATVHMDNGIASIAEGGNDAPPRDQAIGNMHLIAAAPELYDALREVEAVLMIVEPRSNKREYLAALETVRAVLAKVSA